MIKLLSRILPVILLSILVAKNTLAIDYSVLSNQDLYEFKGAMLNAPEPEQKAYKQEWQKRLETFTEEEKKLYLDGPDKTDQKNKSTENAQKPFIPGRGYDKQGTGGVLYGGGSPVQGMK